MPPPREARDLHKLGAASQASDPNDKNRTVELSFCASGRIAVVPGRPIIGLPVCGSAPHTMSILFGYRIAKDNNFPSGRKTSPKTFRNFPECNGQQLGMRYRCSRQVFPDLYPTAGYKAMMYSLFAGRSGMKRYPSEIQISAGPCSSTPTSRTVTAFFLSGVRSM